jgi:ATP-dependent Lon protease
MNSSKGEAAAKQEINNMRNYEDKASQLFGKSAVYKWLTRDAGIPRVPRYAAEWLVGYFCQPGQEANGLKTVREAVAYHVPEPERRHSLLQRLRIEGKVHLYDLVEARVDLKTNRVIAKLSNLGVDGVSVPDKAVKRIPQLLIGGGVWCSMDLTYCPEDRQHPIHIYTVSAFQTTVEPSQFRDARQYFTLDEWVDLLLASVGYEPDRFTPRQKILLLVRLAPVVESNLNLIELGPRQTGKTFLLRNVAPSCYTASGAQVTAASLFANVSTGVPGVLASYKTVVLDEISHTTVDDLATISIMKDYLESGQFSRGGRVYTSDASLVMTGNLDVDFGQPSSRYRHLFEPLPYGLQDTALLDRIHGYLPGWEIPVLQPSSFSTGIGLTTDYVGQMLQYLRKRDLRAECYPVLQRLGLPLTTRDYRAVEKISSALLKLLFPDGHHTFTEVSKIVVLALELRGRVTEQLAIMAPGEFGDRFQLA